MGQDESSINNNKPNQLILNIKKDDFKEAPNLGNSRWFFLKVYSEWNGYNSDNNKENIPWEIFSLEQSTLIEKSYVNKFPYETKKIFIVFNYIQKRHLLFKKNNDSVNKIGIVVKEELSKINIIKRGKFIFENMCFGKIGEEYRSYQYFLVSNLSTIVFNSIFPFKNINNNNFMYNLLSSYMICSIKLKRFLLNQYQNYIKSIFEDIYKEKVSFNSVKKLLLFDFKDKPVYKEYIEQLNENNFESTILAMFLEETDLQKDIIGYQSTIGQNDSHSYSLTTFYLCLLYVLNTINKNEENDKNEISKSFYYLKKKNNKNSNYCNYNQFNEGSYYFNYRLLMTSSNKFNSSINNDKNEYQLIEFRFSKSEYKARTYLTYQSYYYDLSNYSPYRDNIILFLPNSVFKCEKITKNKIIFSFIPDSLSKSIQFMTRENKKNLGILEDNLKVLSDESKLGALVERIKVKDIRNVANSVNVREFELFDEQINVSSLNSLNYIMESFGQLISLSIISNNLTSNGIKTLSKGLKNLSHLKVLNLSYNSLEDENIIHLKIPCKHLEAFILKGNSIGDNGIKELCNELKELPNLKIIDLYDNSICDDGLIYICDILEYISKLENIDFWNCEISNIGIKYFSEKILNGFGSKINKINFRGNLLGEDCLKELINAIKKLNKLYYLNLCQTKLNIENLIELLNELRKLNKNWNYTHCGGAFVLEENFNDDEEEKKKNDNDKLKNIFSYRNINLNEKNKIIENLIITNPNIQFLKRKIEKYKDIKKLIVSKADVDDNFIKEISLLFSKMPKVKILDFSFNNFTFKSMALFSKNLIYFQNLGELNLSLNNLEDNGINSLSFHIGKCRQLKILNLSYTEMNNNGFISLINGMKEKIKLVKLNLSGNLISDISFKVFCKEGDTFYFLKSFDFENCRIGNDGMKALNDNFSKFEMLDSINLAKNKFNDDGLLYFKKDFQYFLSNIINLDIRENDISDGIKKYLIQQGIPSSYLL